VSLERRLQILTWMVALNAVLLIILLAFGKF
jgi:hypothetical protein